jgi:hypothetical protein
VADPLQQILAPFDGAIVFRSVTITLVGLIGAASYHL